MRHLTNINDIEGPPKTIASASSTSRLPIVASAT